MRLNFSQGDQWLRTGSHDSHDSQMRFRIRIEPVTGGRGKPVGQEGVSYIRIKPMRLTRLSRLAKNINGLGRDHIRLRAVTVVTEPHLGGSFPGSGRRGGRGAPEFQALRYFWYRKPVSRNSWKFPEIM